MISNCGAYQENDVAEPYGIEEVVEDVFGEHSTSKPIRDYSKR